MIYSIRGTAKQILVRFSWRGYREMLTLVPFFRFVLHGYKWWKLVQTDLEHSIVTSERTAGRSVKRYHREYNYDVQTSMKSAVDAHLTRSYLRHTHLPPVGSSVCFLRVLHEFLFDCVFCFRVVLRKPLQTKQLCALRETHWLVKTRFKPVNSLNTVFDVCDNVPVSNHRTVQ